MSDRRDKQDLKQEHQYRFAEHANTANSAGTANNAETIFGKLESQLNVNSTAHALVAEHAEHATSVVSSTFATHVEHATTANNANTVTSALTSNNANHVFGKNENQLDVATALHISSPLFYDTLDQTGNTYPVRPQQSYFVSQVGGGSAVFSQQVVSWDGDTSGNGVTRFIPTNIDLSSGNTAILIFPNGGTPTWCTSYMLSQGYHATYSPNVASTLFGVMSVNSTGFVIKPGTDAGYFIDVNRSGFSYTAIVWNDTSGRMSTGTYNGSAIDSNGHQQTVTVNTGLPAGNAGIVFITGSQPARTVGDGVYAESDHGPVIARNINTSEALPLTGEMLALDSGSFTVNTFSTLLNEPNCVYYFIAFGMAANDPVRSTAFNTWAKVGANAAASVTGLGFTPGFAFARTSEFPGFVATWRCPTDIGPNSHGTNLGGAVSNGITAFGVGSLDLGQRYLPSGTTTYGFALATNPAPVPLRTDGTPVIISEIGQGGSVAGSAALSNYDPTEITPLADHLGTYADSSWTTLSTNTSSGSLSYITFGPSIAYALEQNFDCWYEVKTPASLTGIILWVALGAPVATARGTNVSIMGLRYYSGNNTGSDSNDTGWSIYNQVELGAGGYVNVDNGRFQIAASTKYLIRIQSNFPPSSHGGTPTGSVTYTVNGVSYTQPYSATGGAMPTCAAQHTNGPGMLAPFVAVGQASSAVSAARKFSFRRFVATAL